MRRGSREIDQNKRPLHLRFVVLIDGAGFSCRIARKDQSRFTIYVILALMKYFTVVAQDKPEVESSFFGCLQSLKSNKMMIWGIGITHKHAM